MSAIFARMIFSASATHALRAMAHLAVGPQGEPRQGRQLAREIRVPGHYLAKVLATLARAGLLTASRGARGGYRLARPPAEIALLEIVEPFEGRRVRSGCLLQPDKPCRDEGACSAHAAWSGVKATYLGFLERTTLADIQGQDGPRTRRDRRAGRRAGGGVPRRPRAA